MSDEWTEADDIIEEIWEIRRQMWARFDNDPKKLGAYIRELEKSYKGPFFELPEQESRGEPAA